MVEINIFMCLLLFIFIVTLAESDLSSHESFESGRRNMFISIGEEDCQRFDSWSITGSGSLNHIAESTVHTFGLKVDGTTNGATPCDILVGVFTYAGSFGCVIKNGITNNEIKYCDSYPDTPVYLFNHNVRRWGTFVALEQGCTNMLHVNRFYMKNSSANGEKYWTYNQWVGEEVDGERLLSVFQVDSTADNGMFMAQTWSYVPLVYGWYAASFPSCPTDCNYEGGFVTRNVVCRATKPNINQVTDGDAGNHNYISWDESECAGLTKPDAYQMCSAGSCQWVHYDTDWNCLASSVWSYRWNGLCVDGTGNGNTGYDELSNLSKAECEELCDEERECTGFAFHTVGKCKLYNEPLVQWTASTYQLYECYAKTGNGSGSSNASTTGVTSVTQCQSFCSNYSYMAWWYVESGTQTCRCYHVCSSGAPTSGGTFANEIYEQVASGRRKY